MTGIKKIVIKKKFKLETTTFTIKLSLFKHIYGGVVKPINR